MATLSTNEEVSDVSPTSAATVSTSSPETGVETDSTNDITPPGKFELFPKLPLELRAIIWNFVLPGPRAITFRISFIDIDATFKPTTRAIPSPILHTFQESREIAMKTYKPEYLNDNTIYTFFDHKRDAVIMDKTTFYQIQTLTELEWFEDRMQTLHLLKRLRHLVLPDGIRNWMMRPGQGGLFVQLDTLTVAAPREIDWLSEKQIRSELVVWKDKIATWITGSDGDAIKHPKILFRDCMSGPPTLLD